MTGSEKENVRSSNQNIDFRGAVGHLMLLLNTGPDLAFAVGNVAKFVDNPGHAHYISLKRILRYIKKALWIMEYHSSLVCLPHWCHLLRLIGW
jgi:hypothetical protein